MSMWPVALIWLAIPAFVSPVDASPGNMQRRASGIEAIVDLFKGSPELLKSLGIETTETRKVEEITSQLQEKLIDGNGALIRVVVWRNLMSGDTFPVALHVLAPGKTPMESLRGGRLHGSPTFEKVPEYPYREEAEASEFYWCSRNSEGLAQCDTYPSGRLLVQKYQSEIHKELEELERQRAKQEAARKEEQRIQRERQRAVADYNRAVKASEAFRLKEQERVARIRSQEAFAAQLRHQLEMLKSNSSTPAPDVPGGFTPHSPRPTTPPAAAPVPATKMTIPRPTNEEILRKWDKEPDVIILGPRS